MRYLSGSPYRPCLEWEHGGFMAQPNQRNRPATVDGVVWAADNGCYTSGEAFDAGVWLRWLRARAGRGHCLFAVLPDVPFNHAETLARSLPYLDAVRELGYAPALAIQNGATVDTVPWELLGAIFIAGDKRFKTSNTAWAMCHEARRRGLHVHIARRNSYTAVQTAHNMGADTVDGTMIAFAPDANWRRVRGWFKQLCEHAELAPAWGDDTRFMRCVSCGAPVWRVA